MSVSNLEKVFSLQSGFLSEHHTQQIVKKRNRLLNSTCLPLILVPGDKIYDVAMDSSPRVAENERPIALFESMDAAFCDSKGLYVVKGTHFYHFESVMLMVAGRGLPEQHRVSVEMFGCDH